MIKQTVQSKKGAAMIMASVVMLIMVMLSLAMLLISYSLFRTANDKKGKEQTEELTLSAVQSIGMELTEADFLSAEEEEQALAQNKYPLWFYVRENIGQDSWPYYKEGEPGHSHERADKIFQLNAFSGSATWEDWSDIVDEVSVKIYWTKPDTEEESAEDSLDGAELSIEVTGKKDKDFYRKTGHYRLNISEMETYDKWRWEAINIE